MPAKSRPKPAAAPAPRAADHAPAMIYGLAAIIAIGGLTDSIYLLVQAFTGETLTCGGSPDCFKVLGSAYARVAGLPVAGFGTAGYYAAFACATFGAFGSARARRLFAGVVAGMFAATLWFLYVQAFVLHAWCRYCLLSAATTFFLACLAVSLPGAFRRQN